MALQRFIVLAWLLLLSGSSFAEAICAEVKIEIAQQVSLERQAFNARLGIENGVDLPISNLRVVLEFADEQGAPVVASTDPNNVNAVFFFRDDGSTQVSGGTNGAGQVSGNTDASVNWLIIPSSGAGGNTPRGKVYRIGASVSYTQGGENRSVNVVPDTITVEPQPKLKLDYFLPEDVHADDPFTPVAEPPEPFTLGVRIKNTGAGPSRNTHIESAQPTIVENAQGLQIGFSIDSAFVQNLAAQPTFLLNYGDIAPQSSKVGRWSMKTTLSGRFTEFRADFIHDAQLGGALTSLIDTVATHTLVKDVLVNLPGRDTVRDFLALDVDTYRSYESDHVETEVINRSDKSQFEAMGNGTYKLTMPSSILPSFARMVDPTGGSLRIDSVVRVGGNVLPVENAWTSKKRIGAATTYTHYVNVYDPSGSGSYLISPLRIDQGVIAGEIFRDLDDDGVHDPKEFGVSGASLRLTGTTGTGEPVDRTLQTNTQGLFQFPDLAAGSYSVNALPAPGLRDGIATAGSSGGTAAPGAISAITLANNIQASGYRFAKVSTSATPHADLQVTLESLNPAIAVGQSLGVVVRVRNNGPDTSSGRVVLGIPGGLTVVSASTASGSYDSATKTWNFGTLVTPTNVTLQLTVRADLSGPQTFAAQISNGIADPVPANNSANLIIGLASTPNGRSLAAGSVTLPATINGANSATRVSFPQAFSATPVVIVQADNQDADPQALRIANVTVSSFDVLQVEAPGCNGCTGEGSAMKVHWLAALPGAYRLANEASASLLNTPAPAAPGAGVLIKVGTVLTQASQRAVLRSGFNGWALPSWQSVVFPTANGLDFAAPPIVLSSIQSWSAANEGSNLNLGTPPVLTGASQVWLTPAVRNVTSLGFNTALDSSSVDDNGSATPGLAGPETIGYIAIESGVSTQLSSLGGGAPIGLATGVTGVTGVCVSNSLSFPPGSAVNAANLRGFVGLQSRNEDDGGWLRSCGLSNPSARSVAGVPSSAVSIAARIEEDSDLKTDRAHPTTESVGGAIFGGDFVTTPVSLAFLQATRRGEQLDVQFASATEAGHLGYRIWGRDNALAEWSRLHQDLIINASGDSMGGKSYQRSVPAGSISEIRIEDIDVLGHSRFHPALVVGGRSGNVASDQPLDWNAIRAANALTPARALLPTGVSQVLAEVRRTGIQRLSYAELNAAGFVGTSAAALAVLENGQPVPRFVSCPGASFGPGCFVEWLGRTRASLYGKGHIYVLTVDAKSALPVTSGALVSTSSGPREVAAELLVAPDRAYSFSAPVNDPWFDQRLVATTAPVELSRTFTLPARVAGAVNLSVMLWGGLDYAQAAPDHSVELLLNGQSLVTRRFDGLVAETITLPLGDSQLLPSNTLTVRLSANTGYAADVVLLDGFKVSYTRSSTLSDGELVFGQFASVAGKQLLANGSESLSGFTLAGVTEPTTVWTQQGSSLRRDEINTPSTFDDRITALVASDVAHIQKPLLHAPVAAFSDFSPVDYLIVTHPLFEAELGPLISLQQSRGYSVRVARTDAIYAAKSAHERSPQAIRETIAQINPRFVLLVGGDSYDYNDNLNFGSQSYLPTFYRIANPIVRFAASDLLYSDADGDGTPERATGRIPARTVEELRRAITGITERGNTPATRYFATAGGSSNIEQFGLHSRTLLSYLRQGQPKQFALVDEIGLGEARTLATAALAGGADWINYLGHSSPNRWAFQNLLDTSQLAAITRTGLPAIVSQWGCWNNYFVLPRQDTMSHALLLRSNRLASAVIGSSSLAESESHLALGTRFFDLVEDGRIGQRPGALNTLGEALREAKSDLARTAPEHIESNYSITLFGDPAMPLR